MSTRIAGKLKELQEAGCSVVEPLAVTCARPGCGREFVRGSALQQYCCPECASAVRHQRRLERDPGFKVKACRWREKWWIKNREAFNALRRDVRRFERQYTKETEAMPDVVKTAGRYGAAILAHIQKQGRPVTAGELVKLLPEKQLAKGLQALVSMGKIDLRVAPSGWDWAPSGPAIPLDITAPYWAERVPTIPHGETYLPGVLTRLEWAVPPERPIEHRDVVHLHGALSTLLAEGHPQNSPNFTLIPQGAGPQRQGYWWVHWFTERGQALAGHTVQLLIGTRACAARIVASTRLRVPPAYHPGCYEVELDTMTPVSIVTHSAATKSMGGGRPEKVARQYRHPTVDSILRSLVAEVKHRLGYVIDPWVLHAEIVSCREGHWTPVVTGGHIVSAIEGRGNLSGWMAKMRIRCNAPARWLLEYAARMGLGGKRAFGLGRIKLTQVAFTAAAGESRTLEAAE